MQSCLRQHIVGLTPVWARQLQISSLSTTSRTSEDGPSDRRPKIFTQKTPDERKQIVRPPRKENKPHWQVQKEALRRNFPEGWNPPKKISRPSMSLLRTLHKTDPQQFSLNVLSDKFKISPEAVRRILKSKWEPDSKSHDKKNINSQTQQSSAMPPTKSFQQSSDGWVHHEKLETDQIPINLAQALQSSLHVPNLKPSIHKNHSSRQDNSMVRGPTNQASGYKSDNSDEFVLGSAFLPETHTKKHSC